MSADSKLNQNPLDWLEQLSNDGRKFYYNQKTLESSWEKPDCLKSEIERNCHWTVRIIQYKQYKQLNNLTT